MKCCGCDTNYPPRIKLDDAYEKEYAKINAKVQNLKRGESTKDLRNEIDSFSISQGVDIPKLEREMDEVGKQMNRLKPIANNILRKKKGSMGYRWYNFKERSKLYTPITYMSEVDKIVEKLMAEEDAQKLKQEVLNNIEIYERIIPKKMNTAQMKFRIERLKLNVEKETSSQKLYSYRGFVKERLIDKVI